MFNFTAEPDKIETIVDFASYSDWFLIYLLNENLDKMHYRDVLTELAYKIQNQEGDDEEPLAIEKYDDMDTKV